MRAGLVVRSAAVLVCVAGVVSFFVLVRGGSEPGAQGLLLRAESDGPAAVTGAAAHPARSLPDRRSAVGLTFGQPTIAGIQGTGFEPDMRIDPHAPSTLYASVPASASADDSWIWNSHDSGLTWKWVTASHPANGKPVPCNGGGDTELAVDPAGSLYFNDLTLVNFSVGRSDDGGASFLCNNTGVPNSIVDRQWYAIDGNPLQGAPSGSTANAIYLGSNVVGQGAPQCPVSGAANNALVLYRSSITALPPATAGLQFGPANYVTALGSCDEGIMGNIEVSPVPTTTGKLINGLSTTVLPVRHVYIPHDDATYSKVSVARCFPVAFGPLATPNVSDPSGLNCDDLLVKNLGDPATVRVGANFPSLAIDNAGNIYVVWEQAPVDAGGNVGDASLWYAYSTNEGTTWSNPVQIPTPGLNNNVMAWAAAGDDGKVDVAWYGTPAHVTPPPYDPTACLLSGAVPPPTPHGGPDFANGVWGLYLTQTLNGHNGGGVTFSAPTLAGEHHNHRGNVATIMGGLCGDRSALGDFFQLRIGPQGEANVIYSDSNNSNDIGHVMYVRQVGGPGVLDAQTVSGPPIQVNSVSDPSGDGKWELNGSASANLPNLDIVGSTFTRPSAGSCHPANTPCYRIELTLNNLSLSAPIEILPDNDVVWLTQWLVPSDPACASAATACTHGGLNFHVYAEWSQAQGLRCFYGQSSIAPLGGGVTMTYPPTAQISDAGACVATTGANGKITIEVPIGNVSLGGVNPFDVNRLFSVTSSTIGLAAPSDSVPVYGVAPDVIDVARGYDVTFSATAVRLQSFAASVRGSRAIVRWRTASEAGLAGFQVYRGKTRLSRRLIPAHGDAFAHAYVWRGRVRGAGAWRLVAVRVDGTRTTVARR